MVDYEKVDLSLLDSAPIIIRSIATLNVTPATLFRCFEATDSWGWVGIKSVNWETPKPYGRGTTRTIELNQGKVQEYFLLWEQDRRMVFRFEQGEVPLFAALIEDYSVEPVGEAQCRLHWTVGVKLRGFFRIATPLVGMVLRRQFAGAIKDLAKYVDRTYAGSQASAA